MDYKPGCLYIYDTNYILTHPNKEIKVPKMKRSVLKKVCVITAARSEYGVLQWIIKAIDNSHYLHLQLIVTGSHLAPDQGYTIDLIKKDLIKIDKEVEMVVSTKTSVGISKSMGLCAIGFSDAFKDLLPDMIVVVGDRYELLPICSTALIMGIPIAHISGGDVTKGAIDDQIRNSISMLSNLHFPSTEESAKRLRRMLGSDKNIFNVGEPGLENFIKSSLLDRKDLAQSLGLDSSAKWLLVTIHPETRQTVEYNQNLANNLVYALKDLDGYQVIITQANADLGGVEINQILSNSASQYPDKFKFFASLGQICYLSMMKQAFCLIGNSSSGIFESPYLGVPSINIGKRQFGRHECSTVISIDNSAQEIRNALDYINSTRFEPDNYYGDGQTSKKIVREIEKYLYEK